MRALELKIPPGVVWLLWGASMWLLSRAAPAFGFNPPARNVVAGVLVAAGLLISALGVVSFRRARTTVNPLKPATASSLVVSGVYRWTRNPMYLGFLIVLTGWAYFLSNVLGFLLLPAFILYLNRFQILPEEKALASVFGDEFTAYKLRVRRWL